jgi:hypothetical protein
MERQPHESDEGNVSWSIISARKVKGRTNEVEVKVKGKAIPVTGRGGSHMAVTLSALRTGRPLHPQQKT